ncbi:hypothetical protein AYI69_g3040 [Smittium culicis]|uniref:Uncharacterized protein n=1 Tax=Smittium culicis TaxID=133412 RepID=A0A1R1YKS9_9FUNG|nr:hypothetical protein AYI69_g3040 [Smittium culicis]
MKRVGLVVDEIMKFGEVGGELADKEINAAGGKKGGGGDSKFKSDEGRLAGLKSKASSSVSSGGNKQSFSRYLEF